MTQSPAPFPELKSRLAARAPARSAEPGRLETSVALILTPGPRGPEALFIRRAVRAGDPWSGHIGLPGGRREPVDADLLETAVRETREEIGVELSPDCLLGSLDDLTPSAPTLPPLFIRPYAFGLGERPNARLSDEVAETVWLSLRDLPASAGKSAVQVRGSNVEVDCFMPAGLVIWGLTYRIVCAVLPLL